MVTRKEYSNSIFGVCKFVPSKYLIYMVILGEISYLDVKVEIKENRVITDAYCKKTDTHQYLDYRSCHRKYVKMGIPYGQALRLKCIC